MHWNQALLPRVWFQLLLDRLNHQISQNTLHTHNRAWLFHSQLLLFDQASNPLRLRRCECSECGAPGATEGDFIDLDTAGLRRQCRVTAWQGWVRQTHGQDLFWREAIIRCDTSEKWAHGRSDPAIRHRWTQHASTTKGRNTQIQYYMVHNLEIQGTGEKSGERKNWRRKKKGW